MCATRTGTPRRGDLRRGSRISSLRVAGGRSAGSAALQGCALTQASHGLFLRDRKGRESVGGEGRPWSEPEGWLALLVVLASPMDIAAAATTTTFDPVQGGFALKPKRSPTWSSICLCMHPSADADADSESRGTRQVSRPRGPPGVSSARPGEQFSENNLGLAHIIRVRPVFPPLCLHSVSRTGASTRSVGLLVRTFFCLSLTLFTAPRARPMRSYAAQQ